MKIMHRNGLGKFHLSRVMGILMLFISASLFLGCGGSGGSGDTPSGGTGLTYSGTTHQALIDDTNAGDLTSQGYLGTQTGNSVNPFSTSQIEAGSPEAQGGNPLTLELATVLRLSMDDVDFNAQTGYQGQMVQTENGTLSGACGGSSSYTLSYDDQTGAFSGTFNYSGFCSNGVTLSGSASFSGVIVDLQSSQFDWFTFGFVSLTMASNGTTYALDGELSFDFSGSDVLVSIDMFYQFGGSGVCWVNNYAIAIHGNQYTISGRFFHPDYGYIDLATEQVLVIASSDVYPSSGVLLFTGANGPSGGPTRARLQALSATQCQVTADTNGDGTFDYVPDPIAWSEL